MGFKDRGAVYAVKIKTRNTETANIPRELKEKKKTSLVTSGINHSDKAEESFGLVKQMSQTS